MKPSSRMTARWQVVRVFASLYFLHTSLCCAPLVLAMVFPSIGVGEKPFVVQVVSAALVLWILVLCTGSARGAYQEDVGPYLDLATVPADLARERIRTTYRYTWPMTILVGLASVAIVVAFRTEIGYGLIMFGGMAIFGLALLGLGIGWVMKRMFGPGPQENYIKLSEAMRSDVQPKPESPRSGTPSEQPAVPFDRPPV